MPDSLPVPGAGSTPDAPTSIPQAGAGSTPDAPSSVPQPGAGATPDAPASMSLAAPVPIPQQTSDYDLAAATLQLSYSGVVRAQLQLLGAAALTYITIQNASAALVLVDVTLPPSLDQISFLGFNTSGAWVDTLIAALPDRSVAGDGTYADSFDLLTAGQVTALEASGFFAS